MESAVIHEPQVEPTVPDCMEEQVAPALYDEMWRFLKLKNKHLDSNYYNSSEEKIPARILHTNLCTGKSVMGAAHQLITAYCNDFDRYQYARTIFKKEYSADRKEFCKLIFGDIADLFLYEGSGREKKYNLIISIPDTSKNNNYHRIDGEKIFSELDIFRYYTYRPQCMLAKGGYLCVIMLAFAAREIQADDKNYDLLREYNCFLEAMISYARFNHSVLIFKKY